jgi:hypothetical protein
LLAFSLSLLKTTILYSVLDNISVTPVYKYQYIRVIKFIISFLIIIRNTRLLLRKVLSTIHKDNPRVNFSSLLVFLLRLPAVYRSGTYKKVNVILEIWRAIQNKIKINSSRIAKHDTFLEVKSRHARTWPLHTYFIKSSLCGSTLQFHSSLSLSLWGQGWYHTA